MPAPVETHTIHRTFSHEEPRTLRVVADGLAVDVTVGHEDHEGRWVTRVDFLIDDGVTGAPDPVGRVWVRDDARFVRLHAGETTLPGLREPHPPLTLDTVHLLSRLANAVMHGRRVRFRLNKDDALIKGELRHIVKPNSIALLPGDADPRDGRVRITADLGAEYFLPVTDVLGMIARTEFGIED